MTDTPDIRDPRVFDLIIKRSTYASKILEHIRRYCESVGIQPPGSYSLDGIKAFAASKTPTFVHSELPLTKTETMILRTLIKTYPRRVGASEILKYAFRQSRIPDISNVRTHISVINKKFRGLRGENLITFEEGRGYVILTPAVISGEI
jgi:DNA-binding response OmpR family regulator